MDDFKLDPCSDVDLWIDSDEETQERRETDSIQLEDVNSDFDLDDDIEPRYAYGFSAIMMLTFIRYTIIQKAGHRAHRGSRVVFSYSIEPVVPTS
jgi:hypothetical protein